MFEYNDIEYLKDKLKTDLKQGLSEKEVIRRQQNNGKNILEGKNKDGIVKTFFKQLQDPMIYILLVAIGASFFLKEISDAIVIAIVVIINALIGTFQEIKTEKALEMLKKLSNHKCYVIRDGNKKQIDTFELVKGDLVCLENGNSVGADIRIIESNNLSIDESSITGESHPVKKNSDKLDKNITSLGDKLNCAYMSTLVVGGHGKGIVVSTGMNTEIGKIADILKQDDDITPLQKRLFDLGKLLGLLTIGICTVMFVIAVFEKRDVFDMFLSSISLAVAAIPEGLPAVVTIVLAIGVQRMVKVNTIVKRLPSVETLGSVSVVCSDKTGTLTENKLTCDGVYENMQYKNNLLIEEKNLARNMFLCNNSYLEENEYKGTPIEVALINVLKSRNLTVENFKRLDEKEFDSSRKMMSTLNYVENKKTQYTKGAYDRIIGKCKYIRVNEKNILLTPEHIEQISKEIDKQANRARRILAFAYKEDVEKISEDGMIFLGFTTFIDPPRKGVKEAIETFKEAGIKTIMITGDYIKTAYAIGKEIGIANNENECISGDELDKLSDVDMVKVVEKKSIFARVSPQHKARIVTALKENDRIVAMTGDGVNDAPSLKKADIGISMGINGSDVAKEASDMILLDDNFSTIETAIEEGRTIYNNIKKSVLFLLSSNFAEIIVMVMSIVIGLPVPLLPIHILIVNLLTDSIPALALGADNKDEDVMKENPRSSKETLFAKGGFTNTIIYGVIIAMLTMIAFMLPVMQECNYYGGSYNLKNAIIILENRDILLKAQTFAFIVLSLSELFYSLCIRNIDKSVLRLGCLKNKLLNCAICGGVVITASLIFIPFFRKVLNLELISIQMFIVLVMLSACVILFHELIFPFVSRGTKRFDKKTKKDKKSKKSTKSAVEKS